MSDLHTAAAAACEQLDVIYSTKPQDGLFHRLDVKGQRPGNGNASILIYSDGEGGQVWNHSGGSDTLQFWAKSDQTLTPAEAAERRERAKKERERSAALLAEERARAARVAANVWAKSELPTGNPYTTRKQVSPTSTLRQIRLDDLVQILDYHPTSRGGRKLSGEWILIAPISDGDKLTSIEMIDAQGLKSGLFRGQRGGCFWATGKLPTGDGTGLVVGIGEGVATMLTYYQASGNVGIAALSCGNLKSVAKYMRGRYPDARIEVISDVGNGEQCAIDAAKEVNGWLAKPAVGSDINDLQVELGKQAVADCIQAARQIGTEGNDEPKPNPAPQIKKMSDLIQTVFAPIQWVIRGLLPEGLAILSGPPKIGKSWLVMGLCLAKAVGGCALGKFKVDAGEVLLLSLEDNERRLKGRLQTCMGDEAPDLSKFHATTTWKRLDQGGLEDLDAWLGDHPDCRLVVIDTIGKIKAHPKRRGGNAYENDYDSYGELQRLALERHCCILVIHHNRKSDSKNDGDPLEQISGSTGTTGAMDTILMLRRPRGSSGAVLTATGRDIAEAEYGMQFDGNLGQWVVTGAAEEVSLGDSTKGIVDVMREHAGQALRAQEVYDKLGGDIPLPTLRTKLYRLAEKGILTKYNGAFVYTKGVNNVNGDNGSNSDTAVNNGGEVVSINTINTLTPETVLHEIPDFDELPDFDVEVTVCSAA